MAGGDGHGRPGEGAARRGARRAEGRGSKRSDAESSNAFGGMARLAVWPLTRSQHPHRHPDSRTCDRDADDRRPVDARHVGSWAKPPTPLLRLHGPQPRASGEPSRRGDFLPRLWGRGGARLITNLHLGTSSSRRRHRCLVVETRCGAPFLTQPRDRRLQCGGEGSSTSLPGLETVRCDADLFYMSRYRDT